MGLPGSGKTTMAKELIKLIDAVWLNADKVRKEANDWDFSLAGRERQAKRMKDFSNKYIKENNLDVDIEIDGGINYETGKLCVDAGANILVAGSFLFEQRDLTKAADKLNDYFN